jgi:hypothetical protein
MNEIQVARCTGHCCNPVTLDIPPGDLFNRNRSPRFTDDEILWDMLTYIRWRPPSQGGWPEDGVFEYLCKHFKPNGNGGGECTIYGQGKRPWMCTSHPHGKCDRPGCTRRAIPAIPGPCEATTAPEVLKDEDPDGR